MIYGNYLRDKYNNTALKIADAEGVPCVMEYSKGKNLRNYEIYGNSVQDGTPSPDTPIEIQSVGDLTKNLLPNDWESGFISTSSGANQSSSTYVRTKDYFKLDISKNYYISSDSIDTSATISWYFYDENKNFIRRFVSYKNRTIGTSGCQVTIPTNTVFFRLVVLTTDINIKVQIEEGSTATEYEPYHKYKIPITVRGKNLLPNSDWMSGTHSNGFTEQTNVNYITEYTQNSISFNLAAWKGVSSPRFKKDSVKRIVFKINQNQINSDDGYINFYIIIQGYDDNNNKVGSQAIYNNAIADTEYVFDFSAISTSNFYKNSTQFSFCILARKNALSNLIVYDIAYYADTDTAVYEPYIGETKHIYLNEPLRKVGEYADYIDFKNQKVMRQIEVLDDTGTKSIDESLDVVSPPAEESVSLPTLKTVKGTSIMSVDTTIQPSNIKTKYVKL